VLSWWAKWSAAVALAPPRQESLMTPSLALRAVPSEPAPLPFPSLEDRYRALGADLDALKQRVHAELGADDVAHVQRIQRISTAAEIVGRVLLHVSLDPVTWSAGVVALWLHKQLEATEIGHTALHGAYDKLEGAERWKSEGFAWDVPIDEVS